MKIYKKFSDLFGFLIPYVKHLEIATYNQNLYSSFILNILISSSYSMMVCVVYSIIAQMVPHSQIN